jgi:peptide deformylase
MVILFENNANMKTLNDLLQLGNPNLYEKSEDVLFEELSQVKGWVADLDNVMKGIREKYNFGRGIAAPQLGNMKRLIYINIDKPLIILNPSLENLSQETFELWDDCMCFPGLYVRVKRHKSLVLKYLDENFQPQELYAEDAMAELIQHEYDHLEGVLCTMRAVDDKSFKIFQ